MYDMFKTLKYTLLALLAVTVCSCEKEEIGMTATVDLAGEWMVSVDAVGPDGSVVMEDPFGLGNIQIITYNSAANRPDELVVNDLGGFWEFTVKVPCNVEAKVFGSDSWLDNMAYESKVKVFNGSVVFGGALTPSGMPADAIEFEVAFDDDENGAYGIDHYLVKGYRRTGLNGGAE